MAKDSAEPNTPAIPQPDWLFLNEAVELVVSLTGFDPAAVQTALGRALEEGRLQDRPAQMDHSTFPIAWHRWLKQDRVNWRTGEVYFPSRPGFRDLKIISPPSIRPQLPWLGVRALFGITKGAAPATTATTEPATEPAFMIIVATEPAAPATSEAPAPATTEAMEPAPSPLIAAVRIRLDNGDRPGDTVTWDKFCYDIRTDCDAFTDPKKEKFKRGFSDDTIQRAVQRESVKRQV